MISEMFQLSLNTFYSYAGDGVILGLYLASLFYIFLSPRENIMKLTFGYYSIGVLIYFFLPWTTYIMSRILGEDVFWRELWTLPVILIIAYVCTQISETIKKFKNRIICIAACIVVIMFSGNMIYKEINFAQPANAYDLPEEIFPIAQIINENKENPKAALPLNLAPYIRQYDAGIKMTYGRNGKKLSSAGAYSESYMIYKLMSGEWIIETQEDFDKFEKAVAESNTNVFVVTPEMPIYPYVLSLPVKLVGDAYGYEVYISE